MTDKSRSLEERLAALTGRRYAVLTSRATAALYLAFRALDRAGSRIVLPAILCPSPAYAALYAGYRLAFCDVEPETGNISVSALERLACGQTLCASASSNLPTAARNRSTSVNQASHGSTAPDSQGSKKPALAAVCAVTGGRPTEWLSR